MPSGPALISVGEAVNLDGLLERPDWQLDAACRGHPTEMFFPSRGESNDEAKAICQRCRVRHHCLAQALELGEVGIWAGLSARARIGADRRAA